MSEYHAGHPVLAKIHNKANITKGECYFVGFLEGILANSRVDQTEVEPLLATCQAFCENFEDDDAREILVEAEQSHIDTISELLGLLECVTEIRAKNIDADCPKSSANRILGFCAGVACDGIITLNETKKLLERLNAPSAISENIYVSALKSVCSEALEDGIVAREEEAEIASWIARLVGDSYHDTGLTTFGASPVIDIAEDFDVTQMLGGGTFILTGNFEICPRMDLVKILEEIGLVQARSVSRKVDYVIVGNEASRDWRLASMGTKVEQALRLQASGHAIQILSESHLRSFIKAAT